MSNDNPAISFIVPLYNEEEVLGTLLKRLSTFSEGLSLSHEIIFIDDGSSDSTPTKLKSVAMENARYNCILLSRNFGHQYAVSAGLKFARATEAVMILDGDLQDPPELFTDFYKYFKEGYDVVYGIRMKRKENFLKRFSYFLFYRFLTKVSLTPVFVDSGDFSLISKRVVSIMNGMPEDSRFLRGMRSWVGFKQIGVEYERNKRAGGEPKYTLSKLSKLAYDGVFNFSFFPIKLLTYSGLTCFLSSIVYFIVTVARKVIYDDVPVGFTGLLFMIIFFGGIQLISIGIIGEYVFRTFLQVKNRPLFIVKERIEDGKVINE